MFLNYAQGKWYLAPGRLIKHDLQVDAQRCDAHSICAHNADDKRISVAMNGPDAIDQTHWASGLISMNLLWANVHLRHLLTYLRR